VKQRTVWKARAREPKNTVGLLGVPLLLRYPPSPAMILKVCGFVVTVRAAVT
jgi:hypothetical protein